MDADVSAARPGNRRHQATESTPRRRRAGLRATAGVVALAVFPGVVLPDAVADAEMAVGTETIRASFTHDWVSGDGWTPGGSVDVWVTESDGVTVKGATSVAGDDSGWFMVERDQLGPVDIIPGDRVFAEDAVVLKEVAIVSPLSMSVMRDPAYASGALPTGATVQVYVTGTHCEDSVEVADGDDGLVDGAWGYHFGAACPDGLGYFEQGEVNLHDGDGDATVAQPAPRFEIGASIWENWITGGGFTPDSSVDIWINADPSSDPPDLSVGTDYAGGFWTDAGVDLVGGDQLDVSDESSEKSVTLAHPLSVFVDAGPPVIVEGEVPSGDGVQVWAWGSDCSLGTYVADADDGATNGWFAYDASTECPGGLGSDASAVAFHFDTESDFTQVRTAEPTRIFVSSSHPFNDSVQGNGWVPFVPGDITVDPGEPDEVFLDDVFEPDPGGNFGVQLGLDVVADTEAMIV